MHQTFTGSSRRPREVNLSGRKPNPFATVAGSGTQSGTQQAILSAHQDRAQRQRERAELTAAKDLQRTWRGYSVRRRARDAWRRQWDLNQEEAVNAHFYKSTEESLRSLKLLLMFYSTKEESDRQRLLRYGRLHADTAAVQASQIEDPWPTAYLRLEKACLATLEEVVKDPRSLREADDLSRFLTFLVGKIPQQSSHIAMEYYRVLSAVSQKTASDPVYQAVVAPLNTPHLGFYEGFVTAYLARPQSSVYLDMVSQLADSSLISQATDRVTKNTKFDTRQSLWLLGQYIYLTSPATAGASGQRHEHNASKHVPIFARLLAVLAETVAVEVPPLDMDNTTYDNTVLSSAKATKVPLNIFLKDQLVKLVDQESIRSLLSRPEQSSSLSSQTSAGPTIAQDLAGYALTLLRVFPARADDIRMWLYLGPPRLSSRADSVSAVAYFWRESRATNTFKAIYNNSRAAIELLTEQKASNSSWQPPSSIRTIDSGNDWRIILVFLELYTFVLKLMDDEEFLGLTNTVDGRSRNNALPVGDLKDLTIFLKNLGFTMHFHSEQISELIQPNNESLKQPSLSRYFGGASVTANDSVAEADTRPPSLAGITGMSLDYVKGTVTGLLRMIYERDSRRKFLPKDHWLMTTKFDMTNFIQAVVAEEESRHQVQDQDDEDGTQDVESESESWTPSRNRGAQDAERRIRAQRLASQKRYLASVAPRLEILQNMPFLIPFQTRVEIFREFVHLDQAKRRGGHTDPDLWRQSMIFRPGRGDPQVELQRHHAKVRRKHEFEDAFDQFYNLGADLKEPIQITFVDEFDIVEAGIDGGGVTKEFLTSVTDEAFNPEAGLFEANSQHLLYPNPTSVEERKELLRQSGFSDSSPEHRSHVVDLLRRYEFLGRIIGKCMYEGILVDIGFAGFFLIKWALTGGFGAAANESGYRANINDLRDLDEELYQGLLTLKNYTGNVEDLSLGFTVTDDIPLEDGRHKTVERDLVNDGANRAVTNENRLVYISYMARYRLQVQSAHQTNAFLKGLSCIVQPSWLSMFNQSELQTLIGGAASSIDVPDLRRNTQYGGVYVIGDDRLEHPSIRLFWLVMEKMTDEDRRKVLKFVTSTPRAPLLGFGSLNPRFSIRDAGDDEARFPTTSTCVNLLKLPRYKSENVLRDKLLYAVNSGAGFDLS